MKYSMYYYYNSKYKNTIDEITILYRKKSVKLIEFSQKRPEKQRLVIDITELPEEDIEDSLEIFAAAAESHPNLAIKMHIRQDAAFFINKNIDFFYDKFASNWDELNSLILNKVSDVYVTNELGFSIDTVASYCHSKNVNVRVFPNVAQSIDFFNNLDSLTKFFIRPEDVDLYKDYIDYMEFFGASVDLDFCYEIYRDKKWYGLLSQIIIGYKGNELNRELSNMFGLYRTKCKKQCSYNSCSICHRFGNLSMKMGEAELGLDYSKENITREKYIKKIKELTKNEHKIDEASLSDDTDWIKENTSNISEE